MKLLKQVLAIFLFCGFATSSLAANRLSELCLQMATVLEESGTLDSDLATSQNKIFNLYTSGFLELYGSQGHPQAVSGLRKLIKSFDQFDPKMKNLPALVAAPILCQSERAPSGQYLNLVTHAKNHEKLWLGQSDHHTLKAAVESFKQHPKSFRASYYLALAYLLGRGTPCDVTKAAEILKSQQLETDLSKAINTIGIRAPHACLRSQFLNYIFDGSP